MRWNVFDNGCLAALIAVPAVLLGCRADPHRGEPARMIVVRDAVRPAEQRGDDAGERAPSRIEVVVADPHGGAGAGSSPLSQLVGRSVKVQFRRDALGVAAPAPIPPIGQGPGGRAVHLNGVVRSVTGGWIVLKRDTNTYWIPHAAVLVIEQPDAPTTVPAGE